jgi:hypothetical protein
MTLLNAVRRSLPAKVMTLHNTCETTTLADADDVNLFDFFKDAHIDILADFNAFSFTTKLTNKTLGLAVGFRRSLNASCRKSGTTFGFDISHMATLRAGGLALARTIVLGWTLLVLKAQLNGRITISFFCSQLEDLARTRFDYCDGRCDTCLRVKHLGHPDLTAEYAFCHDYSPY